MPRLIFKVRLLDQAANWLGETIIFKSAFDEPYRKVVLNKEEWETMGCPKSLLVSAEEVQPPLSVRDALEAPREGLTTIQEEEED